jgi:hypothetical protein
VLTLYCLTGSTTPATLAFSHKLAPMVRAARLESCGALGVSSNVLIGVPVIIGRYSVVKTAGFKLNLGILHADDGISRSQAQLQVGPDGRALGQRLILCASSERLEGLSFWMLTRCCSCMRAMSWSSTAIASLANVRLWYSLVVPQHSLESNIGPYSTVLCWWTYLTDRYRLVLEAAFVPDVREPLQSSQHANKPATSTGECHA